MGFLFSYPFPSLSYHNKKERCCCKYDLICNSTCVWWSSPIKIRTQCRLDLVKRDCLRPVLIVVGQDQFIIEHIHGVYKCINQAFLKITVCGIAMTELLKPCHHLFTGQLWLLQFSGLDIHKNFFFLCFQLIKPLLGRRRENALLDCFQNVSNGGLGFRKL